MFRYSSFGWSLSVCVLLLALVVVGLACRPWLASCLTRVIGWSSAVPPPTAVFSSAPSVEQLQPLSELVSLHIQVVDILTVEQEGWLTGYKGAWLIYGDACWTTDLQEARIQEVLPVSGPTSVRIELPRPTSTAALPTLAAASVHSTGSRYANGRIASGFADRPGE